MVEGVVYTVCTQPHLAARRAPANWRTCNRTGTGRMEGTTNKCNDVAITYAQGKNQIIITAYFDSAEYTQKIEARDVAVLAQWAVR